MKPILCLAALFLLYGCAPEIYSDYDQSVDFTQYHTFAWYPTQHSPNDNSLLDNEIIENNVKKAGTDQLISRGFVFDKDSPDVLLEYTLNIAKKENVVQQPVYSNPYNYNPYSGAITLRPSYVIGYTTETIPYDEGTLTISMIDRRSNRLIWRGWSVGTVTDATSYEEDILKDMKDIFNHFPLPAGVAQKRYQ